ncbi:FMN-dependent NADH-azoreductase [Amycolatopsis jiangsuensis]|uniref:FMN dependent NADH:quinone oxidoreductase n=1 Tax=Amycolatopsis jiangsuensis TaxID=1181879 RepID=A0A840J7G9_9PSEU|nr:NAD(P)H-dependent oxidoreductase [Amycolatopsis jiangsuensis]MBB4689659.1 FMN-dependent NADH-azoreductase [Amycolatopsis jiangsuensis]
MVTLLRLDTSIRTKGSVSREIADTLERAYLAQRSDGGIVRRDLGTNPIQADVWAPAAMARYTPEQEWTGATLPALAVARELADELIAADVVVIATPLYNYGVSQHLKAWVDMIIADDRFAPRTLPLPGKPVALVVARGGGYRAGAPKEGWDHATSWIVRILSEVWGADVTLIDTELTLADKAPDLLRFQDLAAELRASAHELAEKAGKDFGRIAT